MSEVDTSIVSGNTGSGIFIATIILLAIAGTLTSRKKTPSINSKIGWGHLSGKKNDEVDMHVFDC